MNMKKIICIKCCSLILWKGFQQDKKKKKKKKKKNETGLVDLLGLVDLFSLKEFSKVH